MLAEKNCYVTQATLSRDLKTLRTSKIPTEMGGYRYIVSGVPHKHTPETNLAIEPNRNSAVVSVHRTGCLVVLRTRTGHAQAVAHELDSRPDNVILGTVAGTDTVFVAISETANSAEVYLALSRVVSRQVIDTNSYGL